MLGKRFGNLCVEAVAPKRPDGRTQWHCRCSCGNTIIVSSKNLQRHTKSCGCLRAANASSKDQRQMPEYRSWRNMLTRCFNTNSDTFAHYGGRGISVCARWRGSFIDFLADMGPRPTPLHTLERVDNEQGYNPRNCTWATRKAQTRNRRVTLSLTYQGRTQSIAAWAEELGIGFDCLRSRVGKLGWSAEQALRRKARHCSKPTKLSTSRNVIAS